MIWVQHGLIAAFQRDEEALIIPSPASLKTSWIAGMQADDPAAAPLGVRIHRAIHLDVGIGRSAAEQRVQAMRKSVVSLPPAPWDLSPGGMTPMR